MNQILSKINPEIFESLIKEIKKATPLPKEISIIPTRMCNARCIFCASYGEDSEKFKIPDEKLLSLVKELCDFSPEFINITGGGEPLLKKRSCY